MSDIIRNSKRAGYFPPFIDEEDSDPEVGRRPPGQPHPALLHDLFLTPDRDADILNMPLHGKEEAPPPDSPYYREYMLDQYLGKLA